MSAGGFTLSYSAQAQAWSLTPNDRAALERLFAGDALKRPDVTRAMPDGRFVSRTGEKLVLWRRASDDLPEILSIVDRSLLPQAG